MAPKPSQPVFGPGSTDGKLRLGPIPGLKGDLSANTAIGVYDNLLKFNNIGSLNYVLQTLTGKDYSGNPLAAKKDFLSLVSTFGAVQGGVAQGMTDAKIIGNYDPATKKKMRPGDGTTGSQQNPPISYGSSGPGTYDTTAAAENSAYAQILNTLSAWNLDGLSSKAWDMISDPGYHLNAGEVMNQLRQTDEYKAAFPGMEQIKANGVSMTEAQYNSYESNILDQFNGNGIPTGMLTKQELGTLVANGIYGKNLDTRLVKGYEQVANADPYVKKVLNDWYGVHDGHLLAYMVSPKHGVDAIIKDVQSALIATEAHTANFNGLDQKTAKELAKQMTNSGYSMDYFRTGFAKAAELQPLEQAQVGQRGQATVSTGQILGSTFTGLNQKQGTTLAGDKSAIQLAEQARVAGLQGGGGFTQTTAGGVGVGRAGTAGQGK
jgi:hypothetical protein